MAKFVEEYCVKPQFDADGVQSASGIKRDGKEYPDPQPMSVPVGYSEPPNILDLIRSMVHREELNRKLDAEGFDTWAEANDFEIEDEDVEVKTDYEKVFDPPPEAVPPVNPPGGENAGLTGSAPASAAAVSSSSGVVEAGVASPPPGSESTKVT